MQAPNCHSAKPDTFSHFRMHFWQPQLLFYSAGDAGTQKTSSLNLMQVSLDTSMCQKHKTDVNLMTPFE